MIVFNCAYSDLSSKAQSLLKEGRLYCVDTGVVLTPEIVSVWDGEYLSKEAYRARIETLDALAELTK